MHMAVLILVVREHVSLQKHILPPPAPLQLPPTTIRLLCSTPFLPVCRCPVTRSGELNLLPLHTHPPLSHSSDYLFWPVWCDERGPTRRSPAPSRPTPPPPTWPLSLVVPPQHYSPLSRLPESPYDASEVTGAPPLAAPPRPPRCPLPPRPRPPCPPPRPRCPSPPCVDADAGCAPPLLALRGGLLPLF